MPPWVEKVPQNRRQLAHSVLKPFKMLRGKNGISIFTVARYSPQELITWYAGKRKSNGEYLFSKHVYPVSTNHMYCDGFFGAGDMPVEWLIKEMSAGASLNSSRIEGAVHNGGSNNCFVDWKNYIIDLDDIIRISVSARGKNWTLCGLSTTTLSMQDTVVPLSETRATQSLIMRRYDLQLFFLHFLSNFRVPLSLCHSLIC